MSTVADIADITDTDDIIDQLSSSHVYFLNADTVDTSGYVFEINIFDTSNAVLVDPSFETALQQVAGLPDVSAIAVLDVSLATFSPFFQMKTDSEDITDVSADDLKFGIHPDISRCFADLSFSYSTVVENKVNAFYSDQQIYKDYVRHIAKSITGGYSASDIFSNEANLLQGVQDLDTSFQTLLTTDINTLIADSSGDFKTINDIITLGDNSNINATAYKSAQSLFTIITNSGNDTTTRLSQLLTDISNQSAFGTDGNGDISGGEITVPLHFQPGDKIAIRLVYKSNNTSPLGNNVIHPRPYKILLNLK